MIHITIDKREDDTISTTKVEHDGEHLKGIKGMTLDTDGGYAEVYVPVGEETARTLVKHGFIVNRIDVSERPNIVIKTEFFDVVLDDENQTFNIRFKFLLTNPETMQPSENITNFVFYDAIKKLNDTMVHSNRRSFTGGLLEKRIEQELYGYILDLIHRGVIFKTGTGFMLDREWLFTELMLRGQREF